MIPTWANRGRRLMRDAKWSMSRIDPDRSSRHTALTASPGCQPSAPPPSRCSSSVVAPASRIRPKAGAPVEVVGDGDGLEHAAAARARRSRRSAVPSGANGRAGTTVCGPPARPTIARRAGRRARRAAPRRRCSCTGGRSSARRSAAFIPFSRPDRKWRMSARLPTRSSRGLNTASTRLPTPILAGSVASSRW